MSIHLDSLMMSELSKYVKADYSIEELSLEKLKEIKEICEKASAFPWFIDENSDAQHIYKKPKIHTFKDVETDTECEFVDTYNSPLLSVSKHCNSSKTLSENDKQFIIMASKYMLVMINELIHIKESSK